MNSLGRLVVVVCLISQIWGMGLVPALGAGTSEATYATSIDLGPFRSDFTGWVGMQFTVGPTELRVTGLGRTYVSGNTRSHVVKLVRESDGVDVTDGLVTLDMSAGVVGEFVYGRITDDVILEPFTSYYLLTMETAGGDWWHDLYSDVRTTSVATQDGAVYRGSEELFYTLTGVPGNVYGAVDFKYAAGGGLFPPVVTLGGARDGASYLSGGPIGLTADAVPDDGVIERVEFFAEGTLLGESVTYPYGLEWAEPPVGTHELWAVATDSYGAVGTSAVVSVAVLAPALLVESGSGWWYWDEGVSPGSNWMSLPDAAGWKTGTAKFGYGTGMEATTVGYGPDAGDKHITTYFRRQLVIEEPPMFSVLMFELWRDDGAVIYLNGVEVFRDNLPVGEVEDGTLAVTDVDLGGGGGWVTGAIPSELLVEGVNVVAVEVHQVAADSPDLGFDFEMTGGCPVASVVRGPYLQRGTKDGVIVRWRTDVPGTSRVEYGTHFDLLDGEAEDRVLTTEHEVVVSGLRPNTRYFYSVGTLSMRLEAGPEYSFVTSPDGAKPTRIWVLGDSGTRSVEAEMVRDAYYQYTGTRHTDLWLMLGDNAYTLGLDGEYQRAVFDMYPEMLRKSVLWSTIGNHDTGFLRNPPPDIPYFEIFNFPTRGEAGGVPSGTEKYYSFDYGNVHFVCLDSMISDRRQGGVMATWLESDLEANTNDWLIAFWHHPPYTKGSHDSDREVELIEMRENMVPILESHGVDLVLTGHSHNYERSYLLRGHYGFSTNLTSSMILNGQSGRVTELGPYRKTEEGSGAGYGAVYVVAGSSGSARGSGSLDHPAMFISLLEAGSVVLDVDGKTMNVKFLRETGAVRDEFTILKGGGGDLPFRITSSGLRDGMLTLTWNSLEGEYYSVQCSTNLGRADWVFVSGATEATGEVSSRSFAVPNGFSNAVYRVVNGTDD